MEQSKLPTLAELFTDVELASKDNQLNVILNQQPPQSWVRVNKYANNSLYLPIDKVEYLLRKIFGTYSIAITGQGTAFNGVWVTVRLTVTNPVTGQTVSHDGIGAEALQVKSGCSAADLANINTGALSIAFPKAKTFAIKDAAEQFGRIFGADLNRKDIMEYKVNEELIKLSNREKLQ